MNFYTEVIQKAACFNTPYRVNDIALLEPVFRQAVISILEDSAKDGIPLMVFETYRSQARQELLFKQGATKLKTVGVHHYGLAADLVKNIDGPSWKGDFSFLGKLAKKYNMVWGGDWAEPNIKHSFQDADHIQRIDLSDQPGLFAGTWCPDENFIAAQVG